MRPVDEVQFQRRRQKFDFDMTFALWQASASPGNEQRNRWSAEAADREGSYNFAGAKNPALDALIAALVAADTRENFVAAARALDRVLLSGFYAVPLFHRDHQWVAWRRRIGFPQNTAALRPAPVRRRAGERGACARALRRPCWRDGFLQSLARISAHQDPAGPGLPAGLPSPCRAAARSAPSPGGRWSACWRRSRSRSTRSRAPAPGRSTPSCSPPASPRADATAREKCWRISGPTSATNLFLPRSRICRSTS